MARFSSSSFEITTDRILFISAGKTNERADTFNALKITDKRRRERMLLLFNVAAMVALISVKSDG